MLNSQRFSAAPWFQSRDITVVGLGGAGRGIAETLFLQGHKLTVWDGDSCEPHNVVQGYQLKHNGKKKADVFRLQMSEYVGDVQNLNVWNRFWTSRDHLQSITIACPDSWRVRNEMFEKWKMLGGELFISVGLLADIYTIKVFYPEDVDKWVNRDDAEEESVACTYRQSMYCAKGLASKVTSIINKHVMGLKDLIQHEYSYNGIIE